MVRWPGMNSSTSNSRKIVSALYIRNKLKINIHFFKNYDIKTQHKTLWKRFVLLKEGWELFVKSDQSLFRMMNDEIQVCQVYVWFHCPRLEEERVLVLTSSQYFLYRILPNPALSFIVEHQHLAMASVQHKLLDTWVPPWPRAPVFLSNITTISLSKLQRQICQWNPSYQLSSISSSTQIW